MNITLYIAGPMTGLPELNFPAFFEAEQELKTAGFAVLNPADRAGRTSGMRWSWYLRRGVQDVCDADGVAVLDGWEKSRGACLEIHVARGLSMPVVTLDGWVAFADKLRLD